MSNYEKAYNNKNLSTEGRAKHRHRQRKDEQIDSTNNSLNGKSQHIVEIVPMKATGQSPYSTQGSQVFRGYIHGLHDNFVPHHSEMDSEKAAIANDLCPVMNTNSPGEGAPVASNGSFLFGETVASSTSVKGGVATRGITRHIRGGVESHCGFPTSGAGGGNFSISSLDFGNGQQFGGGGAVAPPGRTGKHIIPADRKVGDIKHIVLHVTQGSNKDGAAKAVIDWFARGPTGSYRWKNKETGKTIKGPKCEDVIRVDGSLNDRMVCKDGIVEKLVSTSIHWATDKGGNVVQGGEEKDIAQHAGGTYNRKSIGIEMCGKSQDGPGEGSGGMYSRMYTDAHLEAVAKLCADICHRWSLQPNRTTIIGHEEISPGAKIGPGENIGKTDFGKKYGQDTGNYWNWGDFMQRVKRYYDQGAVS